VNPLPLCVDLDGTLIRTDALVESTLQLLREKPWMGLAFPLWLLRGRAAIKREIALRVNLDPAKLPYNAEFLAWLRTEKQEGRRLILATAADQTIADAIERHLGIFDEVLASDGIRNLKGVNKLHHLQSKFGNEFEYAGNSSADIPIWQECRSAIVVNARPPVLAAAQAIGRVSRVFK
jgi:phosphoserine phosphatase